MWYTLVGTPWLEAHFLSLLLFKQNGNRGEDRHESSCILRPSSVGQQYTASGVRIAKGGIF